MIRWFKIHFKFLKEESNRLSNNSNYKELHQARFNYFISHGEIVIRLGKVIRHPILIVYQDSTPYSLPLIFPLQRLLTPQEVDELAKENEESIWRKIKPLVKFFYHLRHQNSSGALCILESDNLDNGSEFYSITSILGRVSKWYKGHETGEFPLDNQEVEFFANFNFLNENISYIYGEAFLNQNLIEGNCYFTLVSSTPMNEFFLNSKYLYGGLFIDGIGTNGLFLNQTIEIPDSISINEKLKSSLDFELYPDVVEKLIQEKKILKAIWFQSDREPEPFQSFTDLVSLIGNSDYNTGVFRIRSRAYDVLKKRPESFIFGLRFPNRKGSLEFQLFKVVRRENLPPTILGLSQEEEMELIISSYDLVEAIRGEKLTEESFHLRNSGRADYNLLKHKFINVMGVGAIGSEVADCLSKAGIGSISLLDNQLVSAHNPIRHLAGFENVNELKVNAVARIIRNHNPYVKPYPCFTNLLEFDYTLFPDKSMSISCVADDNVEGYINQQLILINHIAFYVRMLRGGKVVRIFRVISGVDACFNCLSIYRQENNGFVEIPEDPLFPTLKNECNNPIRPSSATDIKFGAALVSKLVLEHLQGVQSKDNHWIWSSEEIGGTPLEPFTTHSQCLPTHNKCQYCARISENKVTIDKNELDKMKNLIQSDPLIETGGVLAGKMKDDGNFIITQCSEPGPNAKKSASRFEKDVDYCQKFLDELYKESDGEIVYLGEWHSHPSDDNTPSVTDLKSLAEISTQSEYLTDKPIMIIFSNEGSPRCTIHPAGKLFYHANLEIQE